MLSAIDSEGSGTLSMQTASTGLHLVTELPSHCNDQAIAVAARKRQIGVTPLSAYYVDTPNIKRQGLLMGFGNTHSESMKGAIRTLCCLIESTKRH